MRINQPGYFLFFSFVLAGRDSQLSGYLYSHQWVYFPQPQPVALDIILKGYFVAPCRANRYTNESVYFPA